MNDRLHAVVAGSKRFVEAVDAHLRLRLGSSPAVARDAGEALRLSAGRGLLVLECAGPAWIDTVKALRVSQGSGSLSIVAAVPPARFGDVDALQRAGVDEAVRWDARVDPVVWAVDRVVAARAALLPPAVRGEDVEAGFVLRELDTPPPLPHAADWTPTPTAVTAVRLTPAQPMPAVVAPAATAVTAVRLTPAQPMPAVVAPAAIAVTAVRLTPAQPMPAVVAPAAVVPAELPPDEAVLPLLAGAVQGAPPADAALRDFTMRVAAGMSELERAALAGREVPCDPSPLRAAAVLRWRVAAVLERARAIGGQVDASAASALPCAIDAALGALKDAAEGLAAEPLAAVADVRNALVREAIELTEALARVAVADAVAVPAARAEPRLPATRMLSNEKSAETERRVHRGWAALLVVAALATGGYHAWRWHERRALPQPFRMGGTPEGLAVHSAPSQPVTVLAGDPTRPIDQAQLEQFRKEQELKGKTVEEVAPGVLVVQPAPPAAQSPPAQK